MCNSWNKGIAGYRRAMEYSENQQELEIFSSEYRFIFIEEEKLDVLMANIFI